MEYNQKNDRILCAWKKKGKAVTDGFEPVQEFLFPQAVGIFVKEIIEGGLASEIHIQVVDRVD